MIWVVGPFFATKISNKFKAHNYFVYHRKFKRGKIVDVRKPKSFIKGGFIPEHETALIIHGFNGTQTSQHIMYLKDGMQRF